MSGLLSPFLWVNDATFTTIPHREYIIYYFNIGLQGFWQKNIIKIFRLKLCKMYKQKYFSPPHATTRRASLSGNHHREATQSLSGNKRWLKVGGEVGEVSQRKALGGVCVRFLKGCSIAWGVSVW